MSKVNVYHDGANPLVSSYDQLNNALSHRAQMKDEGVRGIDYPIMRLRIRHGNMLFVSGYSLRFKQRAVKSLSGSIASVWVHVDLITDDGSCVTKRMTLVTYPRSNAVTWPRMIRKSDYTRLCAFVKESYNFRIPRIVTEPLHFHVRTRPHDENRQPLRESV